MLNFLTFLTHTEIWENFSLKPPKIWQFISEKSEIIPKHFENLTYKSLNFLNILIWTPLHYIKCIIKYNGTFAHIIRKVDHGAAKESIQVIVSDFIQL